jgi:thiamine transport system permease protein
LRAGLGVFLISPFLIWIAKIPSWTWPATQSWLPSLRVALEQASISAFLSLIAGFVLYRALQGWSGRMQHFAEVQLLALNLVPPLFVAMSALTLGAAAFHAFPYGLPAVIFVHVWLNAGLVAVGLHGFAQSKLSAAAEAALVMGASPHHFWWKIAFPLLRGDLACLFLFVFSICFTSFSIPLLLGGMRAASLEVAIYDYIRMDGRWDKAVILTLIQSLMLLLFAWILPKSFWPKPARPGRVAILALPFGRELVFAPTLLLLIGWGWGLSTALSTTLSANVRAFVLPSLLASLALGLIVGLLHLFLFLLTAYVSPHRGLSRFLNGYLAPSPVIVGFALLLVPVESETAAFGKLAIALTLISFPLLYRWIVHTALASLEGQIQIARSLGADWGAILFEIVWPQTGLAFLRAAGLAGVWAVGDFALSGILLGPHSTLPLLMNELIGGYRLESAQWLLPPLMLAGILVYIFFRGMARYVAR